MRKKQVHGIKFEAQTDEWCHAADIICFTLHLATCDPVEKNLLPDIRSKLVFAEVAFCHAVPAVWNSLPQHLIADLSSLTTFKRLMKSKFYNRASVVDSWLFRTCDSLIHVRQQPCNNNNNLEQWVVYFVLHQFLHDVIQCVLAKHFHWNDDADMRTA